MSRLQSAVCLVHSRTASSNTCQKWSKGRPRCCVCSQIQVRAHLHALSPSVWQYFPGVNGIRYPQMANLAGINAVRLFYTASRLTGCFVCPSIGRHPSAILGQLPRNGQARRRQRSARGHRAHQLSADGGGAAGGADAGVATSDPVHTVKPHGRCVPQVGSHLPQLSIGPTVHVALLISLVTVGGAAVAAAADSDLMHTARTHMCCVYPRRECLA